MKNILKLCWYYLEIAYVSLLHMVGVEFSTDSIPCGLHCYEYDKERNINEPFDEGGYWVKPCKYYRSVSKFHIYGCTYIGFLGYSSFLSDQCKMCEEKEEIKAENLDCN